MPAASAGCAVQVFRRRQRTGFTLVEVAAATLIVGLLLVAALSAVGSATQGQIFNAERARAGLLGDALLAEILELPYGDPQGGTGLGRDAGESDSPRQDFDDVDDYAGWSAAPPERKDGTTVVSGAGFTRSVAVDYVDPDQLTAVVSSDQGAKRIIVSVLSGSRTLATVSAVVTDH